MKLVPNRLPMLLSVERDTVFLDEQRWHCFHGIWIAQASPTPQSPLTASLLCARYRQQGMEGIIAFLDDDSFALIDPALRQIFIGRDIRGQGAFYIHKQDGRLQLSTHIGHFFGPNTTPTADDKGVIDFLTFQFTRAPRTVVKDVSKLANGEYYVFTLDQGHVSKRTGRRTIIDFQGMKAHSASEGASQSDNIGPLLDRIYDNFTARVHDKHMAVLLSGGVDSSTNLLHLVNRDARMRALTAAFLDSAFDESAWAARVADQLRVDHELHTCDHCPPDTLRTIATSLREPICDRAVVPTVLLLSTCGGTFDLIVSGEGGDELFGEPRRFIRDRHFLAQPTLADAQRLLHSLDILSLDQRLALIRNEDAVRALYQSLPSEILNYGETCGALSKVQQAQALVLNTWMPENVVCKDMCGALIAGSAVAFPLIDRTILDFIGTLSPARHAHVLQSKRLLTQRLRDCGLGFVADKTKHKFKVPPASWLSPGLWDRTLALITNNPGLNDIFHLDYLEKLETLLNPAQNRVLFGLYIFAEWFNALKDSSTND